MAPMNELEILRKLEPSKRRDENSWPEFQLHNVVVRNKATQEPFSLLSAYQGDAAQVEGVLVEAEVDATARLLKKGFKRAVIHLADVGMYSYGQIEVEAGVLINSFWAAGESGWFRLHSVHKTYQPIYQQMDEAAILWFYLEEKVKRQRVNFGHRSWKEVDEHVKLVFRNYKKTGDHRFGNQPEDYYEAFRRHRLFILKCMLEKCQDAGAEGYQDWKASPYWRWYNKVIPHDVAFMQNVVNGTATGPIDDRGDESPVEADESMDETPPVPAPRRADRRARPSTPPPAREATRPAGKSKRMTRGQAAALGVGDGNSSDDREKQRAKGRSKRKRKSMLRPIGALGSKTPSKSNTRRDGLRAYSHPTMDEISKDKMEMDDKDLSDDEDEEILRRMHRRELRSSNKGKDSVVSAKKKQEVGQSEEDSNEGEGDSNESDESKDDGESDEDNESNSDNDSDDDEEEEEEEERESSQGPSKSYFEPRGPGDSWICPIDGCDHKVWEARSAEGVSLIQQHYAANHKDSVEDLIKSEERPWAHVSYLLAKVRSFRESSGLPAPVVRKY